MPPRCAITTTAAPTDIDEATMQVTKAIEQLKRRTTGAAAARRRHTSFLLSREMNAEPALREVAEALRHHDDVLSAAMQRAGLPKSVLDLLRTWMAVQLEARSSILQMEVAQLAEEIGASPACAPDAAPAAAEPIREPLQLFNANEMGHALGGMSDQIVRDREKSRELFSVLKAGRKRGREYPAFQAWDGIVGAPLATVMKALGSLDGAAAYSFFSSRLHELGGLTPVEVLSGTPTRMGQLTGDAKAILAMSADQRLDGVVKAADAFLVDAMA